MVLKGSPGWTILVKDVPGLIFEDLPSTSMKRLGFGAWVDLSDNLP
jgi:hypothetical protein